MSQRLINIGAALLGSAALLAPIGALAHGPTRQKVVQSVDIAAPPEAVWAVAGNFHDMSWDPAVTATAGDGGNAVNSLRTLTLKSGGQITESLERYEPAQFTYGTFLPHNDPKVLPVSNFSTVLTVSAAGDGKSTVQWRAAAYRGDPNNDPPPELNDEAAVAAMNAFLRTGLDGLKQKIESGAH
nr:SRPBCC family protein [uncultured Rhodopila sp.]